MIPISPSSYPCPVSPSSKRKNILKKVLSDDQKTAVNLKPKNEFFLPPIKSKKTRNQEALQNSVKQNDTIQNVETIPTLKAKSLFSDYNYKGTFDKEAENGQLDVETENFLECLSSPIIYSKTLSMLQELQRLESQLQQHFQYGCTTTEVFQQLWNFSFRTFGSHDDSFECDHQKLKKALCLFVRSSEKKTGLGFIEENCFQPEHFNDDLRIDVKNYASDLLKLEMFQYDKMMLPITIKTIETTIQIIKDGISKMSQKT